MNLVAKKICCKLYYFCEQIRSTDLANNINLTWCSKHGLITHKLGNLIQDGSYMIAIN